MINTVTVDPKSGRYSKDSFGTELRDVYPMTFPNNTQLYARLPMFPSPTVNAYDANGYSAQNRFIQSQIPPQATHQPEPKRVSHFNKQVEQ